MSAPPSDGLNPEQLVAVNAVSGPVLVQAGPGSGKTRVVTHRIANQVHQGVATPEHILAVTFTERAAAEMAGRLRALGVPAGGAVGVRACTFHSAALRQVTYFWRQVRVDAPRLEVLPRKVGMLVPLARREPGLRGIEPQDLAAEIEWIKAQGARLTGEDADGRLAALDLSGRAPAWTLDAQAYALALGTHDGPWPRDLDRATAAGMMARLFDRYEHQKSEAGAVDFDDMLAVARALVVTSPEVAQMVRRQYTHLTVDEFQDVNRLQWDLLTAWLGDSDDVCVVGDDDQAIYGFTGASPRYLAAFRRRFPRARVVTLARNYRSPQPVLDLAGRVLWKPQHAKKALRAADGAPTDAPALRGFQDDEAQRAGVLARCRALRASGLEWQQMAILYRINAQSERWEQTLADGGVPYAVRGEQPFFVRPHVAQALKVLGAALREGAGDPAFGDELHLLDAAPPEQPRLDRVVERVLRRRLSWTPEEPPGERAAERWRDLTVLRDLAVEAVERDPDAHLRDFVAMLLARADAGHAPDGGGVNLMTIHAAKGLEFDAVFVVDCEEGRLPIRQAIERDKRLGIATRDSGSSVAEENRLLYVALTRARRHLHVTWVQRGPRRPSRFLYDVGDGAPTKAAKAAAAPKRERPAAADVAAMAPEEARVFTALREWRRERSRRDDVPAFVVFADATLLDMARRAPSTRVELLGVKGVGPAKAERYGDEVLGVLRSAVT